MTTYYVSKVDGNNSYNGLYETYQGGSDGPWLTLSHVASELDGDQSDDIVKLRCGGTWTEQYMVAGYGTSGHRFIHNSYGTGNKPIIDGEESRNFCIRAVSKNYLEFDGLEIKDAINTGTGGEKDGACIKLESSTGSLLNDLDVYHAKTRGVWFDYCSGCTTQYSLVDTEITDNQYEADGLYLTNGSGNIVRHNEIYEAAQGYYVDGVQTYDDDGITIEYNYIECSQQSDVGSMLIQIEEGSGTVNIRYNILYNTVNQRSIFVLDSSSATFNVYNNVVINAAGGGSWVGIGLDILSGCSIPTCRNNIFYCTNGLCIISSPSISPTSKLDYNCYYRESGGSELIYDGADERTWSQMQGLGYELHGVNADPKFIDLDGKDFRLQVSSPCINAGIDVGLTEDYLGSVVPKGSAPDIGAYEMGGVASDYLENAFIKHVFKVAQMNVPGNLYVALCKSTVEDDDTGSTLPSEVSGGGYARKRCNTWSTPSANTLSNNIGLSFGDASAPWGTITDFAICDHSTAGNMLIYGKFGPARHIGTGDGFHIATNDLDIMID